MKNKLSTLQICTIAYSLILSNNMGITTYNLFHHAEQDCLISIIIGTIIGIIPLFIYLKIINYKQELNIYQKINEKLPIIGKIINLIIAITITYLTALCYFNITNFISSQYLTKTPSLIISIAFLPAPIYLLNKGLTVMGRVSFILTLTGIISVFITIISLIWQVNILNIFPILDEGIKRPLINSLIYICYDITPLFLLTSIPMNNIIDKEKFNKRIIITYIIANTIIFILFFLIISILGVNLTKLYHYPEYDILKKISLVGFVERVESLLSIRWIFYGFITSIFGIYYLKEYIKSSTKIKNDKIIIYTLTIFIGIMSNYLFKNNSKANLFIYNTLPHIITITLIILPIIILTKLKKRKKQLFP